MADVKITALPATAAAHATDLLVKVNDPSGVAVTEKMTITQLLTLVMAQFQGMIVQWSGTIATIPSGWQLCNGTNGTPDLRNLFVVCANADSGGVAKTTLTGVATQSGGSITHTHAITDPTHSHGYNTTALVDNSVDQTITAVTNTSGTSSDPTGITVNNVSAPQPYFALAYIMKL